MKVNLVDLLPFSLCHIFFPVVSSLCIQFQSLGEMKLCIESLLVDLSELCFRQLIAGLLYNHRYLVVHSP
jgi:hypothetical protein